MRVPIFRTTVEQISQLLPPGTDLRSESEKFFYVVIMDLVAQDVLQVETDGNDVVVYVETVE